MVDRSRERNVSFGEYVRLNTMLTIDKLKIESYEEIKLKDKVSIST